MLPTDPAVAIESDLPASGLIEAGSYPTRREASEHGLVVLAMGLPYWSSEADGRFHLFVDAGASRDVSEQLALFDRESVNWPPRPLHHETLSFAIALFTPLIWTLATVLVFRCQLDQPETFTQNGALDAGAIFNRGEWWRAFTALFLHADLGHLISNVAFGTFIFAAVITSFGVTRSWLLIALASIAGNLAAAALHRGENYESIGASTAVFAGIGLLTGNAIVSACREHDSGRMRAVRVPLMAGLAMLGLWGAGGFNTDIVAHAGGFFSGVITGIAAGFAKKSTREIIVP